MEENMIKVTRNFLRIKIKKGVAYTAIENKTKPKRS